MVSYESTSVAGWIASVIRVYCASAENDLRRSLPEPAWGDPLVGYAQGGDPLFEQFKEAVGLYHMTPSELWERTFPGEEASAADLSVICWVLPQTEATKADSRREKRLLPERWARSRVFGEQFNDQLRRHVVDTLSAAGIPAVAPLLSPLFQTKSSERFYLASTWSERHAAHAAGLGTFGLCDGLITPLGKAVRLGSVVARIRLEPTPRPYNGPRDYCLFFSQGTCGECIQRCPVAAISERGHDKRRCQAYLNSVTADYVQSQYGFAGYGCGLCQTGVPCESGIPEGWNKSPLT